MEADVSEESLYARATRLGPTLPGVLSRIAAFFALHPDRVASGSAIEIAAATESSDASVIRTAKALGYGGMKDVRLAAVDLVANRSNIGKVLERRIRSADDGDHLVRVLDDTMLSLERFKHHLDEVDWAGIVEAVATASRVFCYGLTPTGFIAEYLSFMLRRIGADARCSTVTGVLLADYLIGIGEDDVVIVFAPIRQFDEVVTAVRAAKARGATVVLVTEAIGMPIRSEVDHVITTAPTSFTSASDAALPLTVAQALYIAVAAVHPERAIRSMDRINDIRPSLTQQHFAISRDRMGLADETVQRQVETPTEARERSTS